MLYIKFIPNTLKRFIDSIILTKQQTLIAFDTGFHYNKKNLIIKS